MRKAAADLFLGENAAYMCSENAVIESVNSAAKAFGRFCTGDSLLDCMNAEDGLKYEMMWETVTEKPPVTAVLTHDGEIFYGAFYFEMILGKRFSVAVIFDTREECEKALSSQKDSEVCVTPDASRLVEALLDIPDDKFGRNDNIGMYSLVDTIRYTVNDIMKSCRSCDCKVTVSLPENEEKICVGKGLGNFVRCLFAIMYTAGEISCDGMICIDVSWDGETPCIVTEINTEGEKPSHSDIPYFDREKPFSSTVLPFCEFCAGCAGYSFSAVDKGEKVAFVLKSKAEGFEKTEFKCRNCFENYGSYLKSAEKIRDFLAAQKKNEE